MLKLVSHLVVAGLIWWGDLLDVDGQRARVYRRTPPLDHQGTEL